MSCFAVRSTYDAARDARLIWDTIPEWAFGRSRVMWENLPEGASVCDAGNLPERACACDAGKHPRRGIRV